ncbi:MAG: hypothetical protein VB141_13410 [Burkholderia gladioli]
MLIREQGRTIKLLRFERAAETGRCHLRVIGTLQVGEALPSTLRTALTPEERKALERWLSAHHEHQSLQDCPGGSPAPFPHSR